MALKHVQFTFSADEQMQFISPVSALFESLNCIDRVIFISLHSHTIQATNALPNFSFYAGGEPSTLVYCRTRYVRGFDHEFTIALRAMEDANLKFPPRHQHGLSMLPLINRENLSHTKVTAITESV